MYKKVILCLANSWKRGGSCVAGKVLLNLAIGEWVRPISNRSTHEISDPEPRYQDGTLANVLDLIEVSLRTHTRSLHQTENHVIDSGQRWRKSGRGTWTQVQAALDAVPGALWLNGYSTNAGKNDKVPEDLLAQLGDSLKLLGVPDLTLHVAHEPGWQGAPGKRKVRGSFTLNGQNYHLAVTDPLVSSIYLQKTDGDYAIGAATLCISLSEPIDCRALRLGKS
jgi:hypothetical protein